MTFYTPTPEKQILKSYNFRFKKHDWTLHTIQYLHIPAHTIEMHAYIPCSKKVLILKRYFPQLRKLLIMQFVIKTSFDSESFKQ